MCARAHLLAPRHRVWQTPGRDGGGWRPSPGLKPPGPQIPQGQSGGKSNISLAPSAGSCANFVTRLLQMLGRQWVLCVCAKDRSSLLGSLCKVPGFPHPSSLVISPAATPWVGGSLPHLCPVGSLVLSQVCVLMGWARTARLTQGAMACGPSPDPIWTLEPTRLDFFIPHCLRIALSHLCTCWISWTVEEAGDVGPEHWRALGFQHSRGLTC